jgi:hypothetical protein
MLPALRATVLEMVLEVWEVSALEQVLLDKEEVTALVVEVVLA